MTLLGFALVVQSSSVQLPELPPGPQTRWVVDDPEEIVGYLAFNPAEVERRLPPSLRFVSIGELARNGISWARTHLAEHPSHATWGISFLEIVKTGTFTIDGRAPNWPKDGAAALWFARVGPSDPAVDLGPGQPLLVLDFWMSDRGYVAFMQGKGHYARYGDVRLQQAPGGKWSGSVGADGLSVAAECTPVGPITGGVGSAGMQALYPPPSSTEADRVVVAFAGHREQRCDEAHSWKLTGTHPLVRGVMLTPSTFQFGYDLIGGAYSD